MEKKSLVIGVIVGVIVLIAAVVAVLLNNSKTYVVKFVSNNSIYYEVEVKNNDTVNEPTSPTRSGYNFEGWYINNVLFDFSTKINEDITLTAKWVAKESENTDKITVSFDSNGGTDIEAQVIDANSKVIKPINPTRDGYKFVEWQLNSKTFDFKTEVTKSIVLIAKWEKVTKPEEVTKYTVTFDSQNGTSVKSQTVESGKTATKPSNPTRDGYVFKGWYYNGSVFNFNLKITKNITLTAKWEKETVAVVATKYTVTFDTDGGSTIDAQTIEEGKTATKPANPTKKDHEFKGWYLDGKTYDFSTKVTKNIVLTAKWEKTAQEVVVTKYTVTFDSKGGSTIQSQTIESGKLATKPTDPKRDNYIFKGWYLDGKAYEFSSKVTKNIVLTAEWEKIPVIRHDVIKEEDTYYEQARIFVFKDDVAVDGYVDITFKSGEIRKDVEIPKEGRPINIQVIEEIKNVRVK